MKNLIIKLCVAVSYLAMIWVNYLANALPINNRSTGAISDAYPNLFAPAGITFSIWGLIYFLLAGYVIFQFTTRGQQKEKLIAKINPLFIATSLINMLWIFAWHYDYIGVSVILMSAFLVLLIKIADTLRTESMTAQEKLFISTPFFVYFGWITVATIANITVFLVSTGWTGFGIADYIWTSAVLLVGTLIGILRLRKDKQIAYGLVFLWAYLGILLKHTTAGGFDGKYPSVIVTVIACLVSQLVFILRLRSKN
ncbi:MAG: hypothetical protein UX04_C0002G0059 [Microgenomates group bacterium GW2011_GWF2_45_18]|nr:MAG: hypothetical protein UW18_C0001G0038 [Microgenomates group bacterium GW2011_GWF1_44_10]KKU01916.1 MAG: hypothetical protein UX04_C0002G0059 [Microgenomates group bacterium GW2011_GWF2_45_18]OGJ40236.1 MAG: hypothetical protein A2378_03370 [Candidatus Pacebacteria bacterium RIFOXYB1_FULL_44_10]HAU98769.1 lantibiotic ABC transporter permease [Candidatus Paceibacterota bacterium]HAX01411.1 lantibiotic ABC transporter permease [Candidatus Paceibacterota bacterium]